MKLINNFIKSYFFYRLKKDYLAMFSLVTFIFFIIIGIGAPIFSPQNPYDVENISIMNGELPPFWSEQSDNKFLLGTDVQGRDLLSAMLYGLRTSIIIGVGAVLLQALLGISIGLIAGYFGGLIDSILMRIADIQFSIPYLLMAIIIMAILQLTLGVERFEEVALFRLIFVIALAEWPKYARTTRASVLGEKNKEYVEAARVIGLKSSRIIFKHILPNSLTPILVISTIQVSQAIMSEAALSFLGLGMPINRPSLGSLINSGFEYIFSGSWWITIFPGVLLVMLNLVIILFGDWLRDLLNPKLYKE